MFYGENENNLDIEEKKKYNIMMKKLDKEEEISPEDQKKIDEDMKKRQQKKKGKRNPISNQVYGIINKEKEYIEKKYGTTKRL